MGRSENETKCITCGNACGGCSWSRDFTPVEGWFAALQPVKNHEKQRTLESYLVMDCPEYTPDRRIRPEDISNDSVHALAAAVVEQAIADYRTCIRGQSLSGERNRGGRHTDYNELRQLSCESSMTSIERFFRSDWFYTLCDCDGEAIIKRLKEERYLHKLKKAKAKMGL